MDYVYICTIVVLIFSLATAQFDFGEEDDSAGVYIPGRCPENQVLYPKPNSTNEDDGFCDCGAGFIYYTPKDKCFEAYRQGPCKTEEYLIVDKAGRVICQSNPCKLDAMVRFRGRCNKLERSNGCPMKDELKGILKVNATTIKLECSYGDNDGSASVLNLIQVSGCPPGSKRAVTGECRKPY